MDFIFFLIGMIWVLSYQFNKLYWFCLLPHPNRFFHFPNIILAILNGCKTNHIQILKGNINESTKSKMGTFQNQIQHIEKQKQTKKKQKTQAERLSKNMTFTSYFIKQTKSTKGVLLPNPNTSKQPRNPTKTANQEEGFTSHTILIPAK